MVRKWGQRMLWAVVGLILAAFWGEAITRVFFHQNLDILMSNLRADPVAGYIYDPDSATVERGPGYDVPFVINSIGLRDREIPAKSDSVYRVLLVGNSYSVSHAISIDESFSRALERSLNGLGADFVGYDRVEVVNAAVASYTPYNYWKSYTRWADEIQPDAVLVGFVPSREYLTDPEGTRYAIKDGSLAGRFESGEPIVPQSHGLSWRIRKYLAQHSHVYVLLRNFFYYNEKVERVLNRTKADNTAIKSLQPYVTPLTPRVRRGWDTAFSHMEKLKEEAAADDVTTLIAAIPSIYRIDPGEMEALRQHADVAAEQVDELQPIRALSEFCESMGIPLFDLAPSIRVTHERSTAYLPDNHWNARGIESGAAAVAAQWRDAGLPPFGTADGNGTNGPRL